MSLKIGFIGVGKLGKDVAEVMAEKYDVIGYDINKVTPSNFKMVDSIETVVKDRDIIYIAVPTPHHPDYDGSAPTSHLETKDFDYSIVKQVLGDVNKYANKNQLVVLISTVLPGTVRTQLVDLCTNFRFIYNPYLIAMGSVKYDMINPEMVIIGTEDGSITEDSKILIDIYKSISGDDVRIELGTWDEAESIKIFYNTFISAKIGIVNMIQDVSELIGNINVDVVTGALSRSTQRITGPSYMKAGMGDAGGCHPRDNIALRWLSDRINLGYDLFGAIMGSREIQAENIAKKLVKLSKENNLPIYIHGKSYKPGVHYIDGSYSLLIGHFVKQLTGVDPIYIDPLTGDFVESVYGIVLMAHHAPTTYSHNKLIGEKEQNFYCEIKTGSIILDVWRYLKQEDYEHLKIIQYGNTRLK